MEITEVRIKLMEDSDDRLQAFCSITFDDAFVVRDLKIIEGSSGPFVAMPSRKLTSHCPHCGCKNHLRAAHCNQCGGRLKENRALRDHEGRAKLYADIAHPINSECREMIQRRVIAEYQEELERARQPGYVSRYDDEFDDDDLLDDLADDEDEFDEVEDELEDAADDEPETEPPTPLTEHRHIEPPEPEPRGPHKTPADQPAQRQPPSSGASEEFGAGIFDD